MIKKLTVLALLGTLPAQVFPYEYATKAGNNVVLIDNSNSNSTTILSNVDSKVFNKLCFRPAFRGYKPTNNNQNFTITVAMSNQVIDPINMVSLSCHNPASYIPVIPRVNFNQPTALPVFPNGGIDAIVPEPFTYHLPFTTPFSHSIKSNICITFYFEPNSTLNGIDSFNANYLNGKIQTFGSKSAFEDTNCNSFNFGEFFLNIGYNGVTDKYVFNSAYPSSGNELILTGISLGIRDVYTFSLNGSACSKTRLDPTNYVPIFGNPISIEVPITGIDAIFAQVWDLGPMTYESSRTVAIKPPPRYNVVPNSRTLLPSLNLNNWFSFILKLDA